MSGTYKIVALVCSVLCVVLSSATLDKIIIGTLTDKSVPAQEAWTGTKMVVVHRFGGFCNDTWFSWLFSEMASNWNAGRVTHYTHAASVDKGCTGNYVQPDDPNQYIIDGNWDDSISAFTARLKSFLSGPDRVLGTSDDRRLYIRIAHELNGNWFPWSKNSTSYKLMWRYFVDKVRAVGVTSTHVQWVFEPISPGENDADHDFRNYWPGDSYVDWLSLDSYNNKAVQDWYDPWEMFDPMLYRLRGWRPALPVMISETGAESKGVKTGGVARKNAWITTLVNYFANWNVQLMLYFNTNDKSWDWPVFIANSSKNAGVTTITGSDGIVYSVYTNWKSAVQQKAYHLTAPTSPRIMTDDEFQGRLPGYKTRPTLPRDLVIYRNGSNYYDWKCTPASYPVNLTDPTHYRTGYKYSMSFYLTPWGSVQLHNVHMGFNTSHYGALQFSILTTQASPVKLGLRGYSSSGSYTNVQLTVGTPNTWTNFTYTWAQMGIPLGINVLGFYIQGASNSPQGMAYVDGALLLANAPAWPAGWS